VYTKHINEMKGMKEKRERFIYIFGCMARMKKPFGYASRVSQSFKGKEELGRR
jgi:hypothetical protein